MNAQESNDNAQITIFGRNFVSPVKMMQSQVGYRKDPKIIDNDKQAMIKRLL